MQKCELSAECAFYNELMENMPAESGFLRVMYCHKLSHKCQRLKHAGEVSVSDPSNELPPLVLYERR